MTEVTFVDDCQFAVAVAKAKPPPDDYETDSEGDFSDRSTPRGFKLHLKVGM